jgi:hypothetical protein
MESVETEKERSIKRGRQDRGHACGSRGLDGGWGMLFIQLEYHRRHLHSTETVTVSAALARLGGRGGAGGLRFARVSKTFQHAPATNESNEYNKYARGSAREAGRAPAGRPGHQKRTAKPPETKTPHRD